MKNRLAVSNKLPIIYSMILIFEGPDKCGKSSLRESIRKERNHRDVTLDRFFGSMIVYGRVFKRSKAEELSFLNSDWRFAKDFNPLLVVCTANKRDILRRMELTSHQRIRDGTISKTLAAYKNYYKWYPGNKILINTSTETLKQSSKRIIKEIKKLEK